MVSTIRLPYGAFELKRTYRRHMLMGTGFAAMLMMLCIMAGWLFTGTMEMVTVPTTPRDTIIIDYFPPPPIEYGRPGTAEPEQITGKVGIPTPVDDGELIDDNIVIISKSELKALIGPGVHGSDGGRMDMVIASPTDDYIPPPEVFVPMEIQPAVVSEKQPDYPRLALEGGFSAVVTVLVYVDKTGTVRKAEAVKCTRPGMGFEEEAVKAALQWKWRPGIQNGNPIGAWMTHTVRFVLED
ncbi:MAG: energy transducer TonB [candidate division Zixibacteria bacterium]|nr:energy transducer TonB [candidate division Zixibacteria bacterium]